MPSYPLIIPSGPLNLEGVLHLPQTETPVRAGVVVCHPHPQYGGDMHNNVVVGVARALLAHDVAVLRFNFRGAGRSEGSFDGGRGEQDDVLAALQTLSDHEALASPAVGLAGYSFGGGVALDAAARRHDLAALALVSPALASEAGEANFARLTMPKLIVTGAADMFATVERVGDLAARLPQPTETFVSPMADHFWSGDTEEEMAGAVGTFFAKAFGVE